MDDVQESFLKIFGRGKQSRVRLRDRKQAAATAVDDAFVATIWGWFIARKKKDKLINMLMFGDGLGFGFTT